MTTNPFTKQTFNAFCPTGDGGGVDPSCGKGSSSSVASSGSLVPSDYSIKGKSVADIKTDLSGFLSKAKVKASIDYKAGSSHLTVRVPQSAPKNTGPKVRNIARAMKIKVEVQGDASLDPLVKSGGGMFSKIAKSGQTGRPLES